MGFQVQIIDGGHLGAIRPVLARSAPVCSGPLHKPILNRSGGAQRMCSNLDSSSTLPTYNYLLHPMNFQP